ncbi:helix-turn-helix transcriptional regulator [Pseudoclavibacter sp. VKM Ac-2888]|uniref:helix-turn-helix transcriptional regulator n=1 Tax=Pseudoclavibacter sp. VKM Ac-2888 TaxID=2783830 RepID=UPI00188D9AB2|nr:helix-turn-helix domain-containing protein [Pseudoclavibacter sp. VKM Ac-2888]MBF4549210.1 helix-turn-helix domain-containing protein [Pseudoclavibacter sp. VKM Ac-2888]
MTRLVDDELLTTAQAARLLNMQSSTLRNWKYLDDKDGGRRGPKATKVGRLVRYRLTDIEAWIVEQNS